MANTGLYRTAKDVTSDLDLFIEPEGEKVSLLGYHFHGRGPWWMPLFSASIVNGPVSTGREIFPIKGRRNQTQTFYFGPDGIESYKGISIEHGSGIYDVTLIYRR